MLKKFKFIENLSEIRDSDIDELLSDEDSPFIRYQFLKALEESKSVSNINGWKPNHLVSIDDKKITEIEINIENEIKQITKKKNT